MTGEKYPLGNRQLSVTIVIRKVNLQIALVHHTLARDLVSTCHMFQSSQLFNQVSEIYVYFF